MERLKAARLAALKDLDINQMSDLLKDYCVEGDPKRFGTTILAALPPGRKRCWRAVAIPVKQGHKQHVACLLLEAMLATDE